MIDLLIKNAKTIDGESIEIAIKDGKIHDIAKRLKYDQASLKKMIDLKGESYVSAGWIDGHVHCFEKMDLYYDYPDKVGVESGVTTVVDAGTTGAENVGEFYNLAREAKTNVYALLNISKWGIVEQDELADLSKIQRDLIEDALAQYEDFIIGFKARMSKTVIGDNGIIPLEMAKEIQAKHFQELPLMVHIGSAPPSLEETLNLLSPGDIVTHCFNGKENGIYDRSTIKIKEFAWENYRRGLIFDIGHGTDSFNFDVAEAALKEGMKAHMISTDIYSRNRVNGPVYNLATTLTKLYIVGYSWPEIIEKVTRVPAEVFSLTSKGQLKVGYDADLTLFNLVDSTQLLVDSNGNQRQAQQEIQAITTIVGGKQYDINL